MSVTTTPYKLPGNIRLIVTSTDEEGDQFARLVMPTGAIVLTMLELEQFVVAIADAQMKHPYVPEAVAVDKPKRATKRKEVEA